MNNAKIIFDVRIEQLKNSIIGKLIEFDEKQENSISIELERQIKNFDYVEFIKSEVKKQINIELQEAIKSTVKRLFWSDGFRNALADIVAKELASELKAYKDRGY